MTGWINEIAKGQRGHVTRKYPSGSTARGSPVAAYFPIPARGADLLEQALDQRQVHRG